MESLTFSDAELTLDAEIAKWKAHGEAVNRWYCKITSDPGKYFSQQPLVLVWFNKYSPENLRPYHLNHDMAKPYSRYTSADGKVHYGEHHSLKSGKMYAALFGHDRFALMIANDMAFHTARTETIDSAWALPDASHLYATAWAELFANAETFGGTDSDSFKIKKKHLIWALKYSRLTAQS